MMHTSSRFVAQITAIEPLDAQHVAIMVTVLERGRIWFNDWLDLYDGETTHLGRCQVREFSLRLGSGQQQLLRLICWQGASSQAQPGHTLRSRE